MITLSRFLAKKYLRFKHKQSTFSFMITICFIGIMIGSFSLMLTLIITNGFERAIHQKLKGITSHIIISSPGKMLEDTSIKKYIKRVLGKRLYGISSTSMRNILLLKNKTHLPLLLKGVEPKTIDQVTPLSTKIIGSENIPLDQRMKDNGIIIGKTCAENYNLKQGDVVTILIPEKGSKTKIYLTKKKAVITGIFNIGLEEYDSNLVISSLAFLKKIFHEAKGVDTISLALDPPQGKMWYDRFSLQSLAQSLLPFYNNKHNTITLLRRAMPHLTVTPWEDLYPALVASLKLEKYAMFLIIALIALVASMNMISLLFMHFNQKKRDLALLTTLGAEHSELRKIFIFLGIRLAVPASLLGLLCAICTGILLENYPFIELPDVYYISYLPAYVEPGHCFIVFISIILLCFVSTLIPARHVRSFHVTKVLRQE